MSFQKQRLYTLLTVACLVGYVWLLINLNHFGIFNSRLGEVCLFKKITSLPCPSCGNTRAILSIVHGAYLKAFYLNPLSYLLAFIMLVLPLCLLYDFICHRQLVWRIYQGVERFFSTKSNAIISILIVSSNWTWSIYKGI